MKSKFFLVLIFLILIGVSTENTYALEASQLSELQQYRNSSRLYVPNFVVRGSEASFKVFTQPNYKVKLNVEYSSMLEKTTLEQIANDNGVAVFKVKIIDDESWVGKSVAVDAYVSSQDGKNFHKASIQTENGVTSFSNRVYIADKNTEKGVFFSPIQALNQVMSNYDYNENSGYNPAVNQIYNDSTPVYIKNMRDAQDNVR